MTGVVSMSDKELLELVLAARAVAEAAPPKAGTYVSDAKIPWRRIRRLRDALDAAGIEWEPRR